MHAVWFDVDPRGMHGLAMKRFRSFRDVDRNNNTRHCEKKNITFMIARQRCQRQRQRKKPQRSPASVRRRRGGRLQSHEDPHRCGSLTPRSMRTSSRTRNIRTRNSSSTNSRNRRILSNTTSTCTTLTTLIRSTTRGPGTEDTEGTEGTEGCCRWAWGLIC